MKSMANPTATIIWQPFETVKPPIVYERGQTSVKVPYFVAFSGKQVTLLHWHYAQGKKARWEWPNGSIFHGDILFWSTHPSPP